MRINENSRTEYIQGLRELADFLETHPGFNFYASIVSVAAYTWTPEELAEQIKALGKSEKYGDDYSTGAVVKFSGPITAKAYASKNVTCEKVETGEVKTVTKKIDATDTVPEGAKNVRTVTQVVYELDEPEVEWVCPPSLLAAGKEG